ncbi:MAG: Peptidoglycan-binding protein ArfA [Bacteroidetes bacterium ADurb.Bin408]|nr:MAG: Peptidoglycan-binding protein ArfA [Bacteroidetes bacterium ADurb.Bin408]
MLTPERNRVCDKSVAYDAATSLSLENINRGLCKCAYCCHMLTYFHTIPGETYYIVVYNPGPSVTVNLGAQPAQYKLPEPSKEQAQKADKKLPQTFSGNTKIENLQVGQSLTLENIYFEGGTANFLPISYDALEGLLDFLQKNPSVKIEIQGHVNGPNEPPDINYSNNLGYRRARAVYDYLVNRKTDKERLSCKGFGNTQMVYPNAVVESEMAKNRRVEIVIVSK